MLKLQYSPINQAWVFSWNNIALKVLPTEDEAAWFLKNETALEPVHIRELLAGKPLRQVHSLRSFAQMSSPN